MQFEKGQSGNPAGRPPGARNRTTTMAEEMLRGEAEELMRIVIEKAKAGDMTALRLCLERIAPPNRRRAVEVELPEMRTMGDATEALGRLATAAAAGAITPADASEMQKVIMGFGGMLVATTFEQRLAKLEQDGSK
jgi:hypothetical protein